MSHPQQPAPAKLVVGTFMRDRALFGPLAAELTAIFGDIDIVSAWMPFDFTDYYRKEMGAPLHRRMLAFRRLISQEALPAVKLQTNEIEKGHLLDDRRQANIDPGYLLLERFVLASGKNFSHRVYLGGGIYADLTLIYRQGAYRPLPWTYPDYAAAPMGAWLNSVRAKYSLDL